MTSQAAVRLLGVGQVQDGRGTGDAEAAGKLRSVVHVGGQVLYYYT